MKRHVNIYLIYPVLFLILALSVSAVTISNAKTTDLDAFYSSYSGNNIVNLNVTLTGYNTTYGNVLTVVAYFTNIATCRDQGSTINLTNVAGTDTWVGSCDVTDDAAVSSFKTGNITVMATETYGTPFTYLVPITLYNIGLPTGNNCYRFIEGSTNFTQVLNFGNIPLNLVVQAYGSSSCITSGYAWGDSWMTVGQLTFMGVNLANPQDAQKLTQLIDYVKINYSSARTFQNTKVSVDSSMTAFTSVNPFIVILYHLPFSTKGAVVSDNTVPASRDSITWTNNGADPMLGGANTYNLTFTATPGFSGYTITDNVAPKIILSSPAKGQSTNSSTTIISANINSTGSELSKLTFDINGATVASYLGNNGSNTANCTMNNNNSESYTCVFTLSQNEGTYNLLTTAYDYGAGTGNVATDNRTYMIQAGAPKIVIDTPKNDTTYQDTDGSRLKISFSATDGNGIGACSYELTGPVDMSDDTLNCSSNISIQLNLKTGDYELTIDASDTLGLKTEKTIDFKVADDVSAKITSNTANQSNTSSAILSIMTDESAKCRYGTSDASFDDMTGILNGTILHEAKITLSNKDASNKYYVRCKDLSDNINDKSAVISIIYGAIVAPVDNTPKPKVDPFKTFELGTLPQGMKVLSLDETGLPVIEVLLNTNKVTSGVQLTVTATSSPSSTYSEKVYKYIQITHTGVEDTDLNDAKIKFIIPVNWLNDNNIKAQDIILLRYTGTWTPLNTTVSISEDNTTAYYLSTSPGLSLFAISTRTAAMTAALAPVVNITTNATDNLTLLDKDKHKFNWTWVIILAIIVFIVIVLFVLIQRNEKYSPPPIFASDRTLWGRIKRLFR